MNQSMTLPCKICGTELSKEAFVCPKCGDPHPFCFDKDEIIKRAEKDATKVHQIKNMIIALCFILLIVLWFAFHKIWPLIVVFILSSVLYYFSDFIDDKIEDVFEEGISKEYNEYKNKYGYNLSQDQLNTWESYYYHIYYTAKNKKTKQYGD